MGVSDLAFREVCMAQSVKRLTLDFGPGHDLMVCEIETQVRLHAEHGSCLRFSLSLSLLLPLSLSKIKRKKEIRDVT